MLQSDRKPLWKESSVRLWAMYPLLCGLMSGVYAADITPAPTPQATMLAFSEEIGRLY